MELPNVKSYLKHAQKKQMSGSKANPHTLRRILLAFRPYWVQVTLAILAIIFTAVLNLCAPLLIPLVFDDAIAKKNLSHLLLYALIMTITTVLAGLMGVLQTYLNNIFGQRVMRDFRNQLYTHLQDMPLRFFTSNRTGEIQSRLSNDISGVQIAVSETFTTIATNIITTVALVVAMLYISPLLTLTVFVLLPPFLWMTFKIGKIRHQASKAMQESLASLSALMQETLSINGILLIKTFGRKQFAKKLFEVENQKLTQLGIRQQMVGRWFFMFVYIFFTLTPVAVYLIAGCVVIFQLRTTSISIGSIFAFILLQSKFFSPFTQLLTLQVNIQGALALFERIFEYLDLPVEIQDAPDARRFSPGELRGEVAFADVSFTYRRDTYALSTESTKTRESTTSRNLDKRVTLQEPAQPCSEVDIQNTLNNISFHIKPGMLLALVGPSGAGKTTLTYLLTRLYDVDSGAITIDGYNIKDITLDTLGDLIGVVTQETYLFHATVRENLLYARPDATNEEIIAATRAAAIHDRIMELESGYETVVGERGYKLSGGEKQRLAIARVLLKNPQILILDEATSSLDTQSERLIQAALVPLMAKRTTIAIAHRLSTILAADMIIVLDKGRIVEQGTHQELLERAELYAKLYKQQFEHLPYEIN